MMKPLTILSQQARRKGPLPKRRNVRLLSLAPIVLLLPFLGWSLMQLDPTQRELTFHNNDKTPTIDFISVGSLKKPNLQETQQRTFGSHDNVGQFFTVNELDDTDTTCHSTFTMNQLNEVVSFCRNTDGQTDHSRLIRTRLFWPNKHTGWMCAQKRPIDGLRIALDHYKQSLQLPHYLLIIDDDTYVGVDNLMHTLKVNYTHTEAHVVAGCRWTWPRKMMFHFPWGGFGSILSRASLQRLLKPIYCDRPNDHFTQLVCWRLEQNTVGEAEFFQPGMSVGDLMVEHSRQLPFTNIANWQVNGTGFCFHSDHALGFWFNFYWIGVPIENTQEPSDKLRIQYSYEYLSGDSECKNERENCHENARVCHYTQPELMEKLWSKRKQQTEHTSSTENKP